MSKIHLEILDKERRKVFKKLSFFKSYGCLAGGTALALQLGHRKSKDNIGITFVWYYHSPLYSLKKTDSISLSSVFDIAVDKAYTIGRRAVGGIM